MEYRNCLKDKFDLVVVDNPEILEPTLVLIEGVPLSTDVEGSLKGSILSAIPHKLRNLKTMILEVVQCKIIPETNINDLDEGTLIIDFKGKKNLL